MREFFVFGPTFLPQNRIGSQLFYRKIALVANF